jgi:energy-coupling factor transporter transmembrane protein EcfT
MNPVTKLLIIVGFIISLTKVSVYVKLVILFLLLIVNLLRSDSSDLIFLKVIIIAGTFLFLINFLTFTDKYIIEFADVDEFIKKWSLIFELAVLVMILKKIFNIEEIYALFVKLGIPTWFIYLIFNSIFLIPRLLSKAREILISQQVRGFKNRGFQKIKSMALVLVPLIMSMLYEIEQKTAAIYIRGLFSKGPKTHIYPFRFKIVDIVIIIGVIICLGLIIFL